MCDEAPASREVTIAVYGKPAQTAWQRESVVSDVKEPFGVKTIVEWNAYEARCWLSAVVELGLEIRFLDADEAAAVRALDASNAEQLRADPLYR